MGATSVHSYGFPDHSDHLHIEFKPIMIQEERLLPTFEEHNYQELDQELYHKGHGNRMESRKVGRNTHLQRRPGHAIALQVHETDILTYYPDNRVLLNASHWFTSLTKERMNAFLGWNTVSSHNNDWSLRVVIRLWDEGLFEYNKKAIFIEASVPFENGIAINARTHELIHSPNDYMTPINDSLIMREVSDITRSLTIHARTLGDKQEAGTLIRDDLRTAIRHLDAFQQERDSLVRKLEMLESGMDWATTGLEEAITVALKAHADTWLEMNDLRKEVPGQERMKDTL